MLDILIEKIKEYNIEYDSGNYYKIENDSRIQLNDLQASEILLKALRDIYGISYHLIQINPVQADIELLIPIEEGISAIEYFHTENLVPPINMEFIMKVISRLRFHELLD